jgi:hypothetical protein
LSILPTGLGMESLKSYSGLEQTAKAANYKKNLPQTITSAAQATTITKVKTTVPTSLYGMNLPHPLASHQAPINLGNKPKSYPAKTDSPITHSVTSMSQTSVTKTKSVYTASGFKNIYSGGVNYSTADIAKINKPGVAPTKTTPSSQIFKVSDGSAT